MRTEKKVEYNIKLESEAEARMIRVLITDFVDHNRETLAFDDSPCGFSLEELQALWEGVGGTDNGVLRLGRG